MASKSSYLAVTILADIAKLKTGLGRAKQQLKGFESGVKGISRGVNLALGSIGIGLSIQALEKMSKAAVEDAKAQRILADSMRNTGNASDAQISAAEKYIGLLQRQTAIIDDELRPAFSTFYRTTKSLTVSQKLLSIATDVSAGTGKDLSMVSQAIAKAYTGQYTSLNKLIPGINKAKNPIGELESKFKGLAEAAANVDPFARMEIIFNDMQETLGMKLLPYLQGFADYLATPEGSARLDTVIGQLAQILDLLGQATVGLSDFFAVPEKKKGWDGGFFSFFSAWWDGVKYDFNKLQQGNIFEGLSFAPGGGTARKSAASRYTFKPIKITPYKAPVKSQKDVNKDIIKASIKTVKDQLKVVQDGIKQFTNSFRNAVDLSFGIIDTGVRKFFRADKFVRELKRVKIATSDLLKNVNILRKAGGSKANDLINSILGLSPEEASAVARDFVGNLKSFKEAVSIGGTLAGTGTQVGKIVSQMEGNLTEKEMLAEIKLLNKQLSGGKNTYNIKSEMNANDIVNAIRKWEKSTGRKVLR